MVVSGEEDSRMLDDMRIILDYRIITRLQPLMTRKNFTSTQAAGMLSTPWRRCYADFIQSVRYIHTEPCMCACSVCKTMFFLPTSGSPPRLSRWLCPAEINRKKIHFMYCILCSIPCHCQDYELSFYTLEESNFS